MGSDKKERMNLEDQIHENAQLKKKIAKLEEKLILAEVKDKEKSAQIKDFETQIKVLNKQLAEKRGYKTRDENYGEKRKEKYDEIRAKYGLKPESANPFDEPEPEIEVKEKKSFLKKLVGKK